MLFKSAQKVALTGRNDLVLQKLLVFNTRPILAVYQGHYPNQRHTYSFVIAAARRLSRLSEMW